MAHALHHHTVAIGDERQGIILLADTGILVPEIVVFHNHQQVAAAEFFLTVKNGITDTLVVDVRPFVAARHDNGLIHAHPTVAAG